MHLQFISDASGKTTGVFIPIEEWNALKAKYKGIEDNMDIPAWHKDIVSERNEAYRTSPGKAQDFDDAMDEIEKGL